MTLNYGTCWAASQLLSVLNSHMVQQYTAGRGPAPNVGASNMAPKCRHTNDAAAGKSPASHGMNEIAARRQRLRRVQAASYTRCSASAAAAAAACGAQCLRHNLLSSEASSSFEWQPHS
jgi:hypothetical protein